MLPLKELVGLYETISAPILPTKVVGVSVITRGLPESDARAELAKIEANLGLPATDPLRFGVARLADAVEAHYADK